MKKIPALQLYYIYSAITSLLFTMAFTVNLIYQVEMAHLNPLQMVLVGTALETSIFIFEIPTGIVADTFSRRISIIIGVILTGFGFILQGAFPIFWTILLSQVIWGIGYTFTSGATQAWITDEIGESKAGEAFIRGVQFDMIGSLIGTGLGMGLGSVRINLPILASGGLFLLFAGFLISSMTEHNFHPTPSGDRTTFQTMLHTLREGLGMAKRRPILLTILLIGFFFGLYSEGFDRLWTPHMLQDITLPLAGKIQSVIWFGILSIISMLLTLVFAEGLQRSTRKMTARGKIGVLMGLSALLVVCLIAFGFSASFIFAAVTVTGINILRQLIYPLYTDWVNQRIDSQVRATILSTSSQVDAIGQIAGGPLLGWIGTAISLQAALVSGGILLSPVLGLFVRAVGKLSEPTAGSLERGADEA